MSRFSSSPLGLEQDLQEIRADNSSGAAHIAQRGGELLLDALKQGKADEVRALGRALIDAQPAMAPLVNLVDHLFHAIDALQDPDTIKEKGTTALQGFLASLLTSSEKIRGHALPLLQGKKVVLTHSYSSTVIGVLAHAQGIEVICPEGRPLCEGLRTARELGAGNIRVRLAVDFAALSLVGECDVVMVGADAITPEGVVNKIGTYGLALAARDKDVPFYVLAGTEKLLPLPFARHVRIEQKDPKEVTQEAIPHSVVENFYFDVTPLDLITGVVTQEGVIQGNEVRKHLEGMGSSEGLKEL
jgi:translation initiation factor eIF-2B subunit delta